MQSVAQLCTPNRKHVLRVVYSVYVDFHMIWLVSLPLVWYHHQNHTGCGQIQEQLPHCNKITNKKQNAIAENLLKIYEKTWKSLELYSVLMMLGISSPGRVWYCILYYWCWTRKDIKTLKEFGIVFFRCWTRKDIKTLKEFGIVFFINDVGLGRISRPWKSLIFYSL